MTGEYVLPKKKLSEKVAAVKQLEYLPSSSELKKETDIGKRSI